MWQLFSFAVSTLDYREHFTQRFQLVYTTLCSNMYVLMDNNLVNIQSMIKNMCDKYYYLEFFIIHHTSKVILITYLDS